MKIIQLLLAIVMLPLGTLNLTSCATTGVTGAVTSAQAWLNDPANQAMINAIAQTAITIIGAFGAREGSTNATVTGKLAAKYPNVPAGALAEIAKHPHNYARSPAR